jgi:hypothetical protein
MHTCTLHAPIYIYTHTLAIHPRSHIIFTFLFIRYAEITLTFASADEKKSIWSDRTVEQIDNGPRVSMANQRHLDPLLFHRLQIQREKQKKKNGSRPFPSSSFKGDKFLGEEATGRRTEERRKITQINKHGLRDCSYQVLVLIQGGGSVLLLPSRVRNDFVLVLVRGCCQRKREVGVRVYTEEKKISIYSCVFFPQL